MISHYSVYNVMSQYCPIMMSCHNIIYISLMPGSCAGSPSSRSWAGRGRSSGPGHLCRYFHNVLKYIFGGGEGHLLCCGSEARWWSSHCPGHHLTSGGHLVACQRSTCSWGSPCSSAVSGGGSPSSFTIVTAQLLLVRLLCSF